MAEPLRILILEDNPADAELVQFELQEAGLAFTAKVVMTEEDFAREIQEYCPDLILSDYDLPKYNGALALAHARKTCPDTPFILVTGAVTEDRAIDILTQGAKDYVLKTRLRQRLVPAVKRALTEADEHRARKKAEEDLRKAHAELEAKVSERTKALEAEIEERKKAQEDRERLLKEIQSEKDRLTALINSIQDEVWFADKAKKLTLVNPAVGRIFGDGVLEGRLVEKIAASYEVYRADGTPRPVEEAPPLRALKGEVIRDEDEIVRDLSTGKLLHRQVSAAPVRDAAGAIIGSVSVVRDITDQKAAEKSLQESEARLQFALAAARMVAWDYDPVSRKVNILQMSEDVLALPPGQRLEDSDQGYSLIHPDDVEGHRLLVTEAIRDAGSYVSVYRQVRDGEVFWLEERGQAITDETGKTVRLAGVTQNVTTEMAAKMELERARHILAEAQKIAHLGSFEFIAATGTTVWSEEEYRIYGLDPAGPSPPYDVMLEKCIHPDDAALLHETFTKAMQDCTVYELEHRIVRPDGSVRWVYDRARPYFDPQGNLLRFIGATLDITDRKTADEALRASDEQFRVLIQNLQSGIALVDEHGAFIIVNNSFMNMFEIPLDATILNVNNRNWEQWQVFDEQGVLLDVDEHPVRKAALTRKAVKNQLVAVKSPDSRDLKWLLVSAEPLLDKSGEIHRLICTYYDITQRKAAEEALRTSEKKYRHLFENIEEMVTVYEIERDSKGRVVERRLRDANLAFLRTVGVSSISEIRGKTTVEISGKAWSDIHLPAVQEAMDTGHVQVLEVYNPETNRHYITSVTRLDAYSYLGTGWDITERKHAEMELMERTKQLETANKELESFSYSVSHDLKSPLRAIEGFSRMLLKKDADKLGEDILHKLEVIHGSAEKMSHLIDDLLSFSRVIKSGIVIADINMDQLARDVWAEIQEAHTERELELKMANLLPGKGDSALIRQVLVNLLSNAVKFTKTRKPGIIEMGCCRENADVVYTVKDNGVGFDMAYYHKLFGVFQRLHSQEDYEGTGVGLAIVHRIINRHGGRLWGEAEVEKGATFKFTLPAGK